MKKIIAMVLCIVLVISLAGCGKKTVQVEREPIENQHSESKIEAEQSEKGPVENQYSDEKVLKLQYFPELYLEQTEPITEIVDIAYSNLIEIDGKQYINNQELQVFTDYIKNAFNIELNSSWHVFVHFYDMEKTTGMIQFQYFIGEIGTNKSIIFNLNNGNADMILYSCLDGVTDEQALQDRVSSFKSNYFQEQYQLKDGENFESETTNYTYYYDTKSLVYSYAVFFSYGSYGVINNDYGTTCLIDEQGNAVQTETQAMSS